MRCTCGHGRAQETLLGARVAIEKVSCKAAINSGDNISSFIFGQSALSIYLFPPENNIAFFKKYVQD